MKSIVRIIFWIAGGLAVLALVVIAAFALLFDPNALRDDIKRLVAAETGRELDIEGELSLSFYPWLGFAAGTTTLSNAQGFDEPFMARFSSASASLKLLPLLRRRVELSTVTFKDLELNLQRRADGRTNWDDLLSDSEQPGPDTQDAGFRAETIGGIQLDNATIRYVDAQAGSEYTVRSLDLESGGIRKGSDFELRAEGELQSVDPAIAGPASFSGRVAMREDGSFQVNAPRFEIRASGAALPGEVMTVDLEATGLVYTGAVVTMQRPILTIDARAGGDPYDSLDATIKAADLELKDFDLLSLTTPGVVARLRSPSFSEPVETRIEGATLQASSQAQTASLAKVTIETMGMTITTPELRARQVIDAPSFDANIAIARFQPRPVLAKFGAADIVTADPGALSAAVVNADFRYTPELVSLRNLRATLDQSNITGSLSYAESGQLNFDLNVDEVDIDRYRSPSTDSDSGAASVAEVEIPVEQLRELKLDGTLKIGKMRLVALNSSNVTLQIRASNGKIQVNPARASLYDGNYNGDIRLDVSGPTPVLSLNEQLANVQFGPFSKDLLDANRLSGALSGRMTVSGRGMTADAITASANGTAQFSFKDGAYEGTDIWYRVRRARAVIERTEPPQAPAEKRTRFADLNGTATIRDGVLYTDDLSMVMPFMKVKGKGNLKLLPQELDFRFTGDLVDRPDLTADVNDLVGISVPIRVTGTVSQPDVSVDMGAVLANLAKRKLGEKFGLNDPNKPAQDAEAAVEEKKEDLKDQLEDKAKGLLKDLLGGKGGGGG